MTRLCRFLMVSTIILGLHINLYNRALIGVGLEFGKVQSIAFSLGC